MEQEATQEFLRRQRHDSFLISVGIFLPAKTNLVILESDEAVIGNGHAMGVAGEITQHVMRTGKGRLGIDDPVLTEERTQERAERFLVFERLERTGELELVLLESSFQAGDELSAEEATENVDGKEEGENLSENVITKAIPLSLP